MAQAFTCRVFTAETQDPLQGSPCGDISKDVVRFPRQLPFHQCSILTFNYLPPTVDRDNLVGIATRCVLDIPGIESRWGRDFPHQSRPALGPTQPSEQWVESLCRGEAAGEWRWQPTPSMLKKEYSYTSTPTVCLLLGWTLPLPLPRTLYGLKIDSVAK